METKTRLVKILVESEMGHDEFNVPKDKVQKEVEGQLGNDKWVTLEKTDGSTELLTKKDLPGNKDKLEEDEAEDEYDEESEEVVEEDEAEDVKDKEWLNAFKGKQVTKPSTKTVTPTAVKEEWKAKFEDVKSATATHKSKGG